MLAEAPHHLLQEKTEGCTFNHVRFFGTYLICYCRLANRIVLILMRITYSSCPYRCSCAFCMSSWNDLLSNYSLTWWDFPSFNRLLQTHSAWTRSYYEGEHKAEKVNYLEYAHRVLSFSSLFNRKIIEVKIIDDEEYEKNKAFTIELGEPILLEIGQKHGGCLCVFVCVCVWCV